MKIEQTRIIQILYYILVTTFILYLVKLDNKPIVNLQVLNWVLLTTGLLLIASIIWFLWKSSLSRHKK